MVEPITWYRILYACCDDNSVSYWKKYFLYSNIYYNENYIIYNTSVGKVKIHLQRYVCLMYWVQLWITIQKAVTCCKCQIPQILHISTNGHEVINLCQAHRSFVPFAFNLCGYCSGHNILISRKETARSQFGKRVNLESPSNLTFPSQISRIQN